MKKWMFLLALSVFFSFTSLGFAKDCKDKKCKENHAHKTHKHHNPIDRISKPWSPRKDCTGLYGSKKKIEATEVSLVALVKSPKEYKGKTIRVKGVVHDVCNFKGCWLMLKSGKDLMRVRFKGYQFFVPTNSKGYAVEVTGVAKKTTISVKLARHYALDAGNKKLAASITAPQKAVTFTASQVRLYRTK